MVLFSEFSFSDLSFLNKNFPHINQVPRKKKKTGIKVVSKQEKYAKIREKKKSIPIEVLCKNCPPQFASYLTYTRKLKFEDRPDYSSLRRIFRDIMQNPSWCPLNPGEDPNQFDWEKIPGYI